MKEKTRQTAGNVVAVFVGLLAALLLVEIILRLTGFEANYYPSRVQFGWPDPVAIKRLYQTDPELLWVPKGYAAQVRTLADSRPSLVFLGCSCTQFGAYDRFLNELIDLYYPDNAFASVNLGVGGWSTYQGCRQFQRDVVAMKPRVVTVYYGWNDHWCTFGLEDKQIGSFRLRQSALSALAFDHSRLVQLLYKTIRSGRIPEKTATPRVSLTDFRDNLKKIIRAARENDVVPVLVTAPSAHFPGEEPAYLAERWLQDVSTLIPVHETYVRAVRDVAREEKADLVDLYRLFGDLPEETRRESFQTDGIHLTTAGSKRTARFLFDYFEQTGLITTLVSTRPGEN